MQVRLEEQREAWRESLISLRLRRSVLQPPLLIRSFVILPLFGASLMKLPLKEEELRPAKPAGKDGT